MPIPTRKPTTRNLNIRSLTQALAGREQRYGVYRFPNHWFYEEPSSVGARFDGLGAPVITASSPTGIEATAAFAGYQFQATTESGQAATWVVAATSEPLPDGLNLSSSGLLDGTPTEAGSTLITVIATDPVTGATSTVSTVITVELSPVALVAGAPNSQQIDTAYAGFTYSAVGGTGPYTYSVSAGGLPSGMTLSAAGLLSGTPDTSGVSIATIRATDNIGQFAETILTFSVFLPAAPVITSGTPSNPQRSVAYGGFSFTGTGFGTPVWSLTGTVPAGMTLDLNGTNQLTGTPSVRGSFPWTLRLTDIYGQEAQTSFVLEVDQAPAPVITSGAPGPFDQFVAITPLTFTASGGAGGYDWSILGSLPAGITFDGTDTLSGTATVAGVFPITVIVDDALGVRTTQVYNITVNAAAAPVITAAVPPDTNEGEAGYTYQFEGTTTFTPLVWSLAAGTLPPGLTLSNTGLLSGTALAGAALLSPYEFAVRATDQNGLSTVSALLDIEVDGLALPDDASVLLDALNADLWYKFDELSGTFANSGSETGTLSDLSAGVYDSGIFAIQEEATSFELTGGGRIRGDGVQTQLGGAASATGTFIVIARVGNPADTNIVTFHNGTTGEANSIVLQVDSQGRVDIKLQNSGSDSKTWTVPKTSKVVNDDKFHMFAIRQPGDASGPQVVIDGIEYTGDLTNSQVGASPDDDYWFDSLANGSDFITIGARSGSGNYTPMVGFLDELLVIDGVLVSNADLLEIWESIEFYLGTVPQTTYGKFNELDSGDDFVPDLALQLNTLAGQPQNLGDMTWATTTTDGTPAYRQPGHSPAAKSILFTAADLDSFNATNGDRIEVTQGYCAVIFRVVDTTPLANAYFFDTGGTGGGVIAAPRIRIDGTLDVQFSVSGGANSLNCQVDPRGEVDLLDGNWHIMIAVQPADGGGIYWQVDDNYYPFNATEITNTVQGTQSVDTWFASLSNTGGFGVDSHSLGSRHGSSGGASGWFDGYISMCRVGENVLTPSELSDIATVFLAEVATL